MAGIHTLIAWGSFESETRLSAGIPPASAGACCRETRSPFRRSQAAGTPYKNHSQPMTLPAATGWTVWFNSQRKCKESFSKAMRSSS